MNDGTKFSEVNYFFRDMFIFKPKPINNHMPYVYEYINKITQLGVINYTLKLSDTDGILQDVFIPVVVSELENNPDVLANIANNMISECSPKIEILPEVPIDEVPIDEVIDNL